MSNTPKIRFSGFTDDWKQRRIIECASFSKGYGYSKSDIRDKGTPLILYGRLYTKHETVIENVDTFAIPTEGSVYSCGGEVIVPASGETAEDIAVASVVKESGVLLGGDLNVITTNDEINPAFLALSISNGKTHRELSKLAQGKSVVHIHNSDIQSVSLRFPLKREQEKISGFLVNLDGLIRIHQREYEKLVALKAACLDKMFPKNGSKVPEVRFSGFSGDWEQHKANELCSIGTGKSNTQDQVANGKYLFFIRSDIPVRSNKYLYDCEAVITIGDGNIGKVFHYVNGKFDLHQRCYKMTDFKKIHGKYFFYYFSTRFYDRAMKMTAKATVDSVRLEMIAGMDIQMPKQIEEQKKIAEFFSQIDNLISLQKTKVEKLKQLKQSMLHNMFV